MFTSKLAVVRQDDAGKPICISWREVEATPDAERAALDALLLEHDQRGIYALPGEYFAPAHTAWAAISTFDAPYLRAAIAMTGQCWFDMSGVEA